MDFSRRIRPPLPVNSIAEADFLAFRTALTARSQSECGERRSTLAQQGDSQNTRAATLSGEASRTAGSWRDRVPTSRFQPVLGSGSRGRPRCRLRIHRNDPTHRGDFVIQPGHSEVDRSIIKTGCPRRDDLPQVGRRRLEGMQTPYRTSAESEADASIKSRPTWSLRYRLTLIPKSMRSNLVSRPSQLVPRSLLCAIIRFKRVDGIGMTGQRDQVLGGLVRNRQTEAGNKFIEPAWRPRLSQRRHGPIALFSSADALLNDAGAGQASRPYAFKYCRHSRSFAARDTPPFPKRSRMRSRRPTDSCRAQTGAPEKSWSMR